MNHLVSVSSTMKYVSEEFFPKMIEGEKVLGEEEGVLCLVNKGDKRAVRPKKIPDKLTNLFKSKVQLFTDISFIHDFSDEFGKLRVKFKLAKITTLDNFILNVLNNAPIEFKGDYLREITRILDKKEELTDEEIDVLVCCIHSLYVRRKECYLILILDLILQTNKKTRQSNEGVQYLYDKQRNLCGENIPLPKIEDVQLMSRCLFLKIILSASTEHVAEEASYIINGQVFNEKIINRKGVLEMLVEEHYTAKNEEYKKFLGAFLALIQVEALEELFQKVYNENYEKARKKKFVKETLSQYDELLFYPIKRISNSQDYSVIDPENPVEPTQVYIEHVQCHKEVLSSLRQNFINSLYEAIYSRLLLLEGKISQKRTPKPPEIFKDFLQIPSAEEVLRRSDILKKIQVLRINVEEKLQKREKLKTELIAESQEKKEKQKLTLETWKPFCPFEKRVMEKLTSSVETVFDLDLFQHNPAIALFSVMEHFGLWYVRPHKKTKENQPALALWVQAEGPLFSEKKRFYRATMTFNGLIDSSKKITSCDPSWSCYHFFLTPKRQEEIVEDFFNETKYQAVDFPALPSQMTQIKLDENLLKTIWPDGSYIEKIDGLAITIRSPQYDQGNKPCRMHAFVLPKNTG